MPVDDDGSAPTLRVEVVYCPQPGAVDLTPLLLPPGATLADALQASGLLQRHALAVQTLQAGIWSRTQPMDTPLRDQDRVEVYRPLLIEPKDARRLRQQQHRSAAAAR